MVVRFVPPTLTTAPETKLLPVSVNVAFAADAVSATGLTAVSRGTGLLTWRLTERLVPPPGGGLTTARARVVALCSSAAGIVTANDVADTYVVATGVFPIVVVDVPLNPVPVTLMVCATPTPAIAAAGFRADTVGRALVIEKAPAAAALPPPGGGFMTPTATNPARCSIAAFSTPTSCVAETNVVGIGVPAIVTAEPLRKLDPTTVSVIVEVPAFAVTGEKPVTIGGLLSRATVNVAVPPPGEGLEMRPVRLPELFVVDAGRLKVIVEPETTPLIPPSVLVVDGRNPVPVTVTTIAGLPAAMLAGETLVMPGAGLAAVVTVKASAPLVPPPGAGLETLTLVVPGTSAAAGMATVSDVLVLEIGDNDERPNMTVDFAPRLFPDRVSVNPELPAVAFVGKRLVKTGTPFCAASSVDGGCTPDPDPGPGSDSPKGVGVGAGVGAAVGTGEGVTFATATTAVTVNTNDVLPAGGGFVRTIVSFPGTSSSGTRTVTFACVPLASTSIGSFRALIVGELTVAVVLAVNPVPVTTTVNG